MRTTTTRAILSTVAACTVAVSTAAWGREKPRGEAELVANPAFASSAGQPMPHEWTLQPLPVTDACCRVRAVDGGLAVDAPERPFGVGIVWQDVQGIEGQKSYAVDVLAKAEKIPSPYRSILVRLTWTHGGQPLHPAGLMVRGPSAAGAGLRFPDVLVAPKEADGARLSLEVKWPQGGLGALAAGRLAAAAAAAAAKGEDRHGLPPAPATARRERNLELFCQQIDAGRPAGAGHRLPARGDHAWSARPRTGRRLAEPIPGPSTQRLGQAAKQNHLWVVAGLYGARRRHASTTRPCCLDRKGELAGQVPQDPPAPRGVARRASRPAASTRSSRPISAPIAIQICYDWFFPEAAAIFALKGAEIVFAPTWGTTLRRPGRPRRGRERLPRPRPRQRHLPGPLGLRRQQHGHRPAGPDARLQRRPEGLFWCEVDLTRRDPLPWVGHWRWIGPRDRMPSSYGSLLGDPAKPTD